MGKAGAIRAGRAYVELFADQSAYIQGLTAAEGRLKAFGDKVASIGRSMMSLGAVAAAPIALSAKIFGGFEDQMLTVRAVTQAAEGDFARLTDQAKLLGRTTSFTAKQVAEGMTSLGRAGFKPAEIQAAIPAVLNLARATGTDLGQAAEYASNAVRAFGLEAQDTTMVADVLTATANNSAQTVDDLAQALSYVAPVAAEAGETIQSTSKALGVLANMGIKGSMAGTTMRQIFLAMADPATRKKLDDIGVSATDAAGRLRPLGDIMADIGKAMAKLPNAERLSLANALFDKRAISGALKLSTSVKAMEDLSRATDQAGGSAERTAKMMDSGLGGSLRMLLSAAEDVALAVGDAVANKLMDWMSAVRGVAAGVQAWVERNRELVATVTAILAGLIATGAAAWVLGKAVLAIKAGLAVYAGLLKTILLVKTAYAAMASTMLATELSRNVVTLSGKWLAVKAAIAASVASVGGLAVAIGGILGPAAALVAGFTVIAKMAARAKVDMEAVRASSQGVSDASADLRQAMSDSRSAKTVEEKIDALKRQAAAMQKLRDIEAADAARLRGQYGGGITSDPQGGKLADDAEARAKNMDRLIQQTTRQIADLESAAKQAGSQAGVSVTAAAGEAAKAAGELADKLQQEAVLFGTTARQAEILKLQMAGATAEQLAAARAADEHLTKLEQQAKATQAAAQAAERFAKRMADAQQRWIEASGTPEQQRESRVRGYVAEEGFSREQAAWLVDAEDRITAAAERRDRALSAQRSDVQRIQSIEELRLRTQYEGADLERRLLDLQEKRALDAARAAGERLDLVQQEFALRRAADAARDAATYTLRTETAGTFNVAALQSLVAGGVQDRVAAATEQTAKNTKRLLEKADNGLTFS